MSVSVSPQPLCSCMLSFILNFYQHVHYLLDTTTSSGGDIIQQAVLCYRVYILLFEAQPATVTLCTYEFRLQPAHKTICVKFYTGRSPVAASSMEAISRFILLVNAPDPHLQAFFQYLFKIQELSFPCMALLASSCYSAGFFTQIPFRYWGLLCRPAISCLQPAYFMLFWKIDSF